MSVEQEILETGIKVVDLLAPYAKGGKIGEDPVLLIVYIQFLFSSQTNIKGCKIVCCYSIDNGFVTS